MKRYKNPYAHTPKIPHTGQANQTLPDHLTGTAKRAYERGMQIGLPHTCKFSGYMHDVGKAADFFQYKLLNGSNESFNHTLAGIQIIRRMVLRLCHGKWTVKTELFFEMLALPVYAHHIGLPDLNTVKNEFLADLQTNESVYEIDEIELWLQGQPFYTDILKSLEKSAKELLSPKSILNQMVTSHNSGYQVSFLLRMLSSILHQADCIDTMCYTEQVQAVKEDTALKFTQFANNLNRFLNSKPHSSEIDKQRHALSENCRKRGTDPCGIYKLSSPVGSGKTFGSMQFALTHAIRHRKDRIIYVVPQITTTRQNAQSIRLALGCSNNYKDVFEKHSSFRLPPAVEQTYSPEDLAIQDMRMQDLNAPIVFTTMVGFENALFGGRYANYVSMQMLANAVIIIDEIQYTNLKKYNNLIFSLNILSQFFRTTILICTATVPEMTKYTKFPLHYASDAELTPDVQRIRKVFDRVSVYNLVRKGLQFTPESLVDFVLHKIESQKKSNAIVVVNTKKQSQECYRLFQKKANGNMEIVRFNADGKIYLEKIIDAIKNGLQASNNGGKKFILVATSIAESGMDFSFQMGFRSVSSLVSLEQTSGRINRHGEYGQAAPFYIFSFDEKQYCPDQSSEFYEMWLASAVTKRLLQYTAPEQSTSGSDFFSESLYDAFYRNFQTNAGQTDYMDYLIEGTSLRSCLDRIDLKNTSSLVSAALFRTGYENFRSIESDVHLVLCPTAKGVNLIRKLKNGERIPLFHPDILKNSIGVREHKLMELEQTGAVETVHGISVLHPSKLDQFGAVLY